MGVFGGTFDPIHQGHLRTVASVQQQLGLAQVLFIPAARPRLRSVPTASATDRLEMLKRALASELGWHFHFRRKNVYALLPAAAQNGHHAHKPLHVSL